jgi:hypothetical protein
MSEENHPTHVLLTPKGEARIVETDGQTVTLHAPFPAPPGCPLEGTLKDTPHSQRVKVHGSRAIVLSSGQPGFEIRGRWVNLSRDARLLLVAGPQRPGSTTE